MVDEFLSCSQLSAAWYLVLKAKKAPCVEQDEKSANEAGEMMTQWLRLLLLEDPGLIPNTHMAAHNYIIPVPAAPNTLKT